MDRFSARTANRADAPAVVMIYNQGIVDRVATFETELRTPEAIASWFDGRHPVVVTLGAEGALAGYAAAFGYNDRCVYAGIAEFSVYVRRDLRGQGAGKVAMKALIKACAEAGYWKLVSRVFPENTGSRALLGSLGFREVGVHEKHGMLDGAWRDVIVVERLLPENQNG